MAQTELKDKTEDKTKVQRPKEYKVIIWNDDFTPMEFVVEILVSVFHKANSDAFIIMAKAHKSGSATVGMYTLDTANSLCEKAASLIRQSGFPLTLTVEEV